MRIIPNMTTSLSSKQVWHTFFLHSLLRDSLECGTPLVLPDAGDHDDHLKHALELRNQHILHYGQWEKMHACSVCKKFISGSGYQGKSGSISQFAIYLLLINSAESCRAVVVDGHYMGRPSCKLHNCTIPLGNNRHQFCSYHLKYSKQCVVTDCNADAEKGHRTCPLPSHREIEERRNAKGQAFFKLAKRLKRLNIGQVVNSFMGDTGVELDDDDNEVQEDTPKSDQGDRRPKARFGRRRTHNEQLVVCCCGVIAARTTMFGAEAISGVKVRNIQYSSKLILLMKPSRIGSSLFTISKAKISRMLYSSITTAVYKNTFVRRKIVSSDRSFCQLMYFTSKASIRRRMLSARSTATLPYGKSWRMSMGSGCLTHQRRNRRMYGWVGIMQLCAKCFLTGTIFSSTR
jgi:hypothetical protein